MNYTQQNLRLAHTILTHLGYAVFPSMEPGANPKAERLAELLHDDARVLPELTPVDGDQLPPIGSKVFIHLSSLNDWVEHTVVGYYVWPALDGVSETYHRVNVRVRDAEGFPNARLLRDVRRKRPTTPGDFSPD